MTVTPDNHRYPHRPRLDFEDDAKWDGAEWEWEPGSWRVTPGSSVTSNPMPPTGVFTVGAWLGVASLALIGWAVWQALRLTDRFREKP